jgi:leader peptidase (prepilin peptidase)/N-methyltransferase
MSFSFALISLIVLLVKMNSNLFNIYDLLSGPVLASFFAFFWLVSSGKWMGLGDAKLALGVGWLLGMTGGTFAIILSFWIGAIFSLLLIAYEKVRNLKWGIGMKSEIPFAPFIILSTLIQFLTGLTLFKFILLFS